MASDNCLSCSVLRRPPAGGRSRVKHLLRYEPEQGEYQNKNDYTDHARSNNSRLRVATGAPIKLGIYPGGYTDSS